MRSIFISSIVHPSIVEEVARLGQVFLAYGEDAVEYDRVKADIDAVLLRSGHFTEQMMAGSPRLRIVARHGAGTDTVDIPAATRHGIWVTNTPGANSRAVAEHVFALILSITRKLDTATTQTRGGVWAEQRTALTGIELQGRTLGLLGQGSIGSVVARLGEAFGMKVLVSDPALDQNQDHVVGIDELLRSSDIVSLHVPLLPSTRRIIDASAIAKMKDGAIVINTGRGGIVDEDALAEALRANKLGGAGLDVIDAENTDMISPMRHNRLAIADVPNLLVTPHIGGQTEEAMLRVGMAAVEEIRTALGGQRPKFALNDVPQTSRRQ